MKKCSWQFRCLSHLLHQIKKQVTTFGTWFRRYRGTSKNSKFKYLGTCHSICKPYFVSSGKLSWKSIASLCDIREVTTENFLNMFLCNKQYQLFGFNQRKQKTDKIIDSRYYVPIYRPFSTTFHSYQKLMGKEIFCLMWESLIMWYHMQYISHTQQIFTLL